MMMITGLYLKIISDPEDLDLVIQITKSRQNTSVSYFIILAGNVDRFNP